eukprot:CAMPEP_0197021804 /NCGR_PEP_ID=MMETSP1384-20130603/2713_1 /TAXON_ID=29189 /ORGANISM="Ammonia sp." /LENGTH=107 /DNA_ID=CAMNT_0042449715 /DNA_START=1286 /DNA_END=1609 /DNA_ORIENTATION=-
MSPVAMVAVNSRRLIAHRQLRTHVLEMEAHRLDVGRQLGLNIHQHLAEVAQFAAVGVQDNRGRNAVDHHFFVPFLAASRAQHGGELVAAERDEILGVPEGVDQADDI